MDKGQIQGRKETTSKVLSYSLEERRCNLWAKNEKRCFRSQQCTKMELFFFFCACLLVLRCFPKRGRRNLTTQRRPARKKRSQCVPKEKSTIATITTAHIRFKGFTQPFLFFVIVHVFIFKYIYIYIYMCVCIYMLLLISVCS